MAWYNNLLSKFKIANLGENASEYGLTPSQLFDRIGTGSFTGQDVSESTAMRVSAVYGCVSLIAGAISSMSTPVYERTETGRKKSQNHEYWWLLNEQANAEVTASTMWTYLTSSLLFYGDAYLEIERFSLSSNKVKGFKLLHPRHVEPFRDSNNKLKYRITPYTDNNTIAHPQYILDPADIIHVPSLGFDGLTSVSPITWAARQSIGIALAAEEYSAKFFKNGAASDVAIKSEKNLTPDQAESIRASYAARNAGHNNYHTPMVLSGGLSVEKLSINPDDAALISTREFTVEEICRVFRVPPHMVGHTSKSTSWGTGIEQQSIGFVKYTLLPLITAIQQEFNRKLWPTRQKYFIEFNTASLERGDIKTRYEAYRIMLGRAGERPVLSVNDVRRLENYEPIEGGDDMSPVTSQQSDNQQSDTEKAQE
jgi:HK97 family phage portal protein